MSTITFKALIGGVHFDPKNGVVKIQLIASSHVSMDKLVRLGPSDENVTVTLQSPQTEIDVFPHHAGIGEPVSPEHEETDEERLEREALEYERQESEDAGDDPKEEEGTGDN